MLPDGSANGTYRARPAASNPPAPPPDLVADRWDVGGRLPDRPLPRDAPVLSLLETRFQSSWLNMKRMYD